jgi:hypothetical protein
MWELLQSQASSCGGSWESQSTSYYPGLIWLIILMYISRILLSKQIQEKFSPLAVIVTHSITLIALTIYDWVRIIEVEMTLPAGEAELFADLLAVV